MASGGISGVAVALASAGGVLIYAGFQGQSPLEALRDVTSGKTKILEPSTVQFTNDPTNLAARAGGGGVMQADYTTETSDVGARIVAATANHRTERYSGARRWAEGFSDCSSFVGKCLKDAGITPPGGSTTWSYLAWGKLKNVKRTEIQGGDILVSGGHAAIALSATHAIGMQNHRQNVRADTIENIMWGQLGWVARRYPGSAKKKDPGGSGSSGSSGGAGVASV
jgi:hypothetical protein